VPPKRARALVFVEAARTSEVPPVVLSKSLEISGPFALFRNTRLYGRALSELIPLLAWCARFRLRALCILEGRPLTLQLTTGDPTFPTMAPRQYDSRLEERFAREFRRLAPEWDVVREPEPIAVEGTLIFPDFALQHRRDPGRRWLLEVMGFWTPDYVARKLAFYRKASLSNLILCLDEARNCAAADLPEGALIVRFRRRVDPVADSVRSAPRNGSSSQAGRGHRTLRITAGLQAWAKLAAYGCVSAGSRLRISPRTSRVRPKFPLAY